MLVTAGTVIGAHNGPPAAPRCEAQVLRVISLRHVLSNQSPGCNTSSFTFAAVARPHDFHQAEQLLAALALQSAMGVGLPDRSAQRCSEGLMRDVMWISHWKVNQRDRETE